MTEVPKIVQDRLRAAQSEALPGRGLSGESVPRGTLPSTVPSLVHPDADLLTAFAEQALSTAERDNVLDHLALCGDCREVVVLAHPDATVGAALTSPDTEIETPAIPAESREPRKSRWNWLSSPHLAWRGLRWAALAAGVAVAASLLLLHPGKLNQAMLPSPNRQVAPAANSPAVSSTVTSSPVASAPVTSTPAEQSTELARTLAKTDEAQLKPELRMSRKLKAGRATLPLQGQSGMVLAGNRDQDSSQPDKVPAPSGRTDALDNNASFGQTSGQTIGQTMTESVEVTGAAEAVVVEPSSPGTSQGTLMAQAAAPAIEKAKPAPQETEVFGQQKTEAGTGGAAVRLQGGKAMSAAKLAASPNQTVADQTSGKQSLTNNITWTIKTGILQRSLDSGLTWQNALQTDHPLLCYADHHPDIWTGGRAGTLFHSSDNGQTWAQVQPSVKTHALTSDITRIDIHEIDIHENVDNARGLPEIVLSTSNHELWTSTDGGQTWAKK